MKTKFIVNIIVNSFAKNIKEKKETRRRAYNGFSQDLFSTFIKQKKRAKNYLISYSRRLQTNDFSSSSVSFFGVTLEKQSCNATVTDWHFPFSTSVFFFFLIESLRRHFWYILLHSYAFLVCKKKKNDGVFTWSTMNKIYIFVFSVVLLWSPRIKTGAQFWPFFFHSFFLFRFVFGAIIFFFFFNLYSQKDILFSSFRPCPTLFSFSTVHFFCTKFVSHIFHSKRCSCDFFCAEIRFYELDQN